MSDHSHETGLEIAVIGIAGRFPQARDTHEFWKNLIDEKECISFFTDEEIIEDGISPELLKHPDYVKAHGLVDNIEMFDANFFNVSDSDAEILDPQHRIFLECCWEALEDSGLSPEKYKGPVGVYSGQTLSTYMMYYLSPLKHQLNEFDVLMSNDKDTLALKVSYKLNLEGPSLAVGTECSTTLVAVHIACQGLLAGECKAALAGGVSIKLPQKSGYIYSPDSIGSPDGYCRAFDADAQGTVGGNGCGVVVLKLLQDALEDGDHIYAVIKGSAINNDGAHKVAFTAPREEAQMKAIRAAHEIAEVPPQSITYVETHGTGTKIGDPIEMAAMVNAFKMGEVQEKQYCAIGSVKTNVGHLGPASGITGLIKTVLMLHHKKIPASLHFKTPHPNIPWKESPFYVNTHLKEWEKQDSIPRRAGVSSFGVGGTNIHMVLEEAPSPRELEYIPGHYLMLFSAKTETALKKMNSTMTEFLKKNKNCPLSDIAYTLQHGRNDLYYRQMFVCKTHDEMIDILTTQDQEKVSFGCQEENDTTVIWMFPGQGTQYSNMGKTLYNNEPVFTEVIDQCAGLLEQHIGLDIRDILYPGDENKADASEQLNQTAITQCALFSIEYALASLWKSWGIQPAGMIGYGVGEYTAACIAGVFSLEDALALVARRASLVQQTPEGAMLLVSLPEDVIKTRIDGDLSIAAVNGPGACVVSGEKAKIESFKQKMISENVECRLLHTSHAFHSRMMEPVAGDFKSAFGNITLQAPEVPFISNVTGTWITASEAQDPGYWAAHLSSRILFYQGINEIMKRSHGIFLELGPGTALSSLVASTIPGTQVSINSLPDPGEKTGDEEQILKALGRLWLSGVSIDWEQVNRKNSPRRISLPTYPFERKKYWLDMKSMQAKGFDIRPLGLQPGPLPAPIARQQHKYKGKSENTAYTPPRNEFEEGVAACWKDLLKCEQEIGIYDNFFDLGGHSISATQFISRLRDTYKMELQLDVFFENPTISEISEVLRQKYGEEQLDNISTDHTTISSPGQTELPPITKIERSDKMPVYASQHCCIMLKEIESDDRLYNVFRLLSLQGKLNQEALQQAFTELVRRHELLRSVIYFEDGKPYQKFAAPEPFPLKELDFSSLTEQEQEKRIKEFVDEESVRPFDLSGDLLLRGILIHLGEQNKILFIMTHHVTCDLWSLGVMDRELWTLYKTYNSNELSPLPEPEFQYIDFAEWQTKYLLSEDRKKRYVEYWRQKLEEPLPVLTLPADFPRTKELSFLADLLDIHIDRELMEELKKLANQERATLFMIMLTSFQVLLSLYSGQEDILIGAPVANRKWVEIHNMLGNIASMIIIRTDLSENPSFRELLRRVRKSCLEAYAHQDIPFDQLIMELMPKRNPDTNPLCQALFNLQSIPPVADFNPVPELHIGPYELKVNLTRYEVEFRFWENETGLDGVVCYHTDLYKKERIVRMIEHYMCLLEEIVKTPNIKLSEILLLTRAEKLENEKSGENTGKTAAGNDYEEGVL
jgi:acyl transferase domain-containing protein/acyl carrier protein